MGIFIAHFHLCFSINDHSIAIPTHNSKYKTSRFDLIDPFIFLSKLKTKLIRYLFYYNEKRITFEEKPINLFERQDEFQLISKIF